MLDVAAGAVEEERNSVGAVELDGVLSEGKKEEEVEGDAVGVVADGEDDSGVTEGAGVANELGVPVAYVTFLTTPR